MFRTSNTKVEWIHTIEEGRNPGDGTHVLSQHSYQRVRVGQEMVEPTESNT